MKKLITISLIILCLIGLFQAGILRALLMFILIGAIPGTNLSLSPDIMTGIVVAVCLAIAITALGMLTPQLVTLYSRYVLRKKLLTIPAFRRQAHTRQA